MQWLGSDCMSGTDIIGNPSLSLIGYLIWGSRCFHVTSVYPTQEGRYLGRYEYRVLKPLMQEPDRMSQPSSLHRQSY